MLPSPGGSADQTLAHPLTEPYALPVSPLLLAYLGAGLVIVVAFAWPPRRGGHAQADAAGAVDATASWSAPLTIPLLLGRVTGVGLLALAIVAGRLGVEDQLENAAPALVVGAGWPMLVLASVLLGPVWRWIDPWDTLSRPIAPAPRPVDVGTDRARDHAVWPAVLVALGWMWYVAAYAGTLQPRSVGLAVAAYTILTVGGCLALGRVRWLASAEVVGILLGWMALLPTRRLSAWRAPAGAEALLGVVAGGTLFAAARRSELWGSLNTIPHAELVATLGLVVASAAMAALLTALGWAAARRGAAGSVARAAVPAVAGIVLAVAMERHRLTTSLQLLPGLLGDPLGRGWDWLGPAASDLDPEPFGTAALIGVQLGVLLVGVLVGVVAAGRRSTRGARLPMAVAAALLADAGVLAIATH